MGFAIESLPLSACFFHCMLFSFSQSGMLTTISPTNTNTPPTPPLTHTQPQVRNPATGAVYIVAESRLEAIPGAVPKGKKGGGGGAAASAGSSKSGSKAGSKKGSKADVTAAAAEGEAVAVAAAEAVAAAAGGKEGEGGKKGGGGFEVIGKMQGKELVSGWVGWLVCVLLTGMGGRCGCGCGVPGAG